MQRWLRWQTKRLAMKYCRLTFTPRSHSSLVKAAQRQFLAVLCVTIIVIFLFHQFLSLAPEPPSRPNIIHPTFYYTSEVEDDRKLGNAMFAFASLIGISHQNNATPVVPSRIRLTETFKIRVAQSGDMLNTMGGSCVTHEEYGRRGGAYDITTRYLHEKKSNIKLGGYFQSFKYFELFDTEIRENFQFNDELRAQAEEFHADKIPKEWIDGRGTCVRVGIHVRRGDMTEDFSRNYGYVTAPADYFSKAINYFKTHYDCVVFIVCTNDIKWARENLSQDRLMFSVGNSAGLDLAILSLCDHLIVSVGSFGWWAAWLSNGTSIYYDKWPRPLSQLEYQVEKQDYFPTHWIGMH